MSEKCSAMGDFVLKSYDFQYFKHKATQFLGSKFQ